MKNELISVIVPVYNVELYLEKCIHSIIQQTYKNIEILLIDDGSLDKSKEICDAFAKEDSRIKVFHQKNRGLSAARNKGIELATASYLMFIDSDDFIESEMIERLYNKIKNDEADICCCGKILDYELNHIAINNKNEFSVNNEEALLKLLINDDIDNSACDKLFKRELFECLRFPVGRYYEDIATIYQTFMASKKISHINYLGYHYCIRKNSISKESFSIKQFDALLFSKQTKDAVANKYPNLKNAAEAYYYLELMTTLRRLKKSSNFVEFQKEYLLIKKEFNKSFISQLKNNKIPFHKKIMSIFIYFKCYRFVEVVYCFLTQKK